MHTQQRKCWNAGEENYMLYLQEGQCREREKSDRHEKQETKAPPRSRREESMEEQKRVNKENNRNPQRQKKG